MAQYFWRSIYGNNIEYLISTGTGSNNVLWQKCFLRIEFNLNEFKLYMIFIESGSAFHRSGPYRINNLALTSVLGHGFEPRTFWFIVRRLIYCTGSQHLFLVMPRRLITGGQQTDKKRIIAPEIKPRLCRL